MSVSVIIPVYNDVAGLRRCLQGLERQSYPRDLYEVIVVDNGSEEPVHPVVEEYPMVRLIHESQGGSYAARNAGITVAAGTALAFIDADCIPDVEWLGNGIARLVERKECGLVGGRVRVTGEDQASVTAAGLYDMMFGFPQRTYVARARFSVTANLFTWRAVVQEVGPFDPRFRSGGDVEWGRRVANAGFDLLFASDAAVRHPARDSLGDLVRKQTRVTRGACRLMRQRIYSPSETVVLLANAFVPPLIDLAQLVGNRQLRWVDKFGVAGVMIALRCVRAATIVRCLPFLLGRGDTPSRRGRQTPRGAVR